MVNANVDKGITRIWTLHVLYDKFKFTSCSLFYKLQTTFWYWILVIPGDHFYMLYLGYLCVRFQYWGTDDVVHSILVWINFQNQHAMFLNLHHTWMHRDTRTFHRYPRQAMVDISSHWCKMFSYRECMHYITDFMQICHQIAHLA